MDTGWLSTFDFGTPQWLWGLVLLALLPFTLSGRRRPAAVSFSTVSLLSFGERPRRPGLGDWRLPLRLLIWTLLVLALARPRLEQGSDYQEKMGIDIVMVLDYSKSMDTEDFFLEGKPISRLTALNKVVADFIENRENDRIGVIGFASDPYLVSPLTSDHDFVTEIMGEVETQGGTAVGSGMVAAVELLKDSDAETKVQIMVTDGLSNTGVPPMEAAEYARSHGIRVYTVEILDYRRLNPGRVLDHPLHKMAQITGGQFYQAADFDSLANIYRQIDDLETSLIKERIFKLYTELFPYFIGAALAVLLLERLLQMSFRRVCP